MVTRQDIIFGSSSDVAEGGSFAWVITDRDGIHARPAGIISGIVRRYDSEITVEAGEKSCTAESVAGLMSLGAVKGTRLVFRASGPDSKEALQELSRYVKENL